MTAEQIREIMDNVAAAGHGGIATPNAELRMISMMSGEIAAQLAELNANLMHIFHGAYYEPKLNINKLD